MTKLYQERIGDQDVTLRVPQSLTLQMDLENTAAKEEWRAWFAALGCCIFRPRRLAPTVPYSNAKSAYVYGAMVAERLFEQGVDVRLDPGLHTLALRCYLGILEGKGELFERLEDPDDSGEGDDRAAPGVADLEGFTEAEAGSTESSGT